MVRLRKECLRSAAQLRRSQDSRFLRWFELSPGHLEKKNSDFTASMLRDLESGYRTEHEHIIGSMLRRGKQAKLDCPSLQLAYAQMTIRELKES